MTTKMDIDSQGSGSKGGKKKQFRSHPYGATQSNVLGRLGPGTGAHPIKSRLGDKGSTTTHDQKKYQQKKPIDKITYKKSSSSGAGTSSVNTVNSAANKFKGQKQHRPAPIVHVSNIAQSTQPAVYFEQSATSSPVGPSSTSSFISSSSSALLQPQPQQKVFYVRVQNLHPDVSLPDVESTFAEFGVILNVDQVGTGHCIVCFANSAAANAAIAKYHGQLVDGRLLQLAPYIPPPPLSILGASRKAHSGTATTSAHVYPGKSTVAAAAGFSGVGTFVGNTGQQQYVFAQHPAFTASSGRLYSDRM